LVFLDRERCIQCGRCVRFQSELAADPVLAFYQRGRTTQIITCSEPGFDSYFSGNTTDICPVGALTTADFRFGARPWEMNQAASICSHCAVGCNITYNVRREVKSGGRVTIKRAMPRQNEAVNEIWLCDKGRFAYHFTETPQRLSQPLVRRGGELQPASWEEALSLAVEKIQALGADLVTLAGGRLSNESLFNLKQLTDAQGGMPVLYTHMAGGDLVTQMGVGQGTNFADMGKGSVILVVACDLEEEAPIWWLRVRQAARRGAVLIVANPRPTKLDRFASHQVRYRYGEETTAVQAFLPGGAEPLSAAAQAFNQADNAVILFGSEGLGLAESQSLSAACARVLQSSGHTGRPNNGLIGVWHAANLQGAWNMGFRPVTDLSESLSKAGVVLAAAADPAGDDPVLAQALDRAGFVVVQELFLTETARRADVVLPVLACTEMEGSFTSGECRVQRFYPVVPSLLGARSDFAVEAEIAGRLGTPLEGRSAARVMAALAARILDYREASYQKLSETAPQLPDISQKDLYYGGTGYENQQGLGVQLVPAAQHGEVVALPAVQVPVAVNLADGDLLAVPITRLYDHGVMTETSPLLELRLVKPGLYIHPQEAGQCGLENGEMVDFNVSGVKFTAALCFDPQVPAGVLLVPRSAGLPISCPMAISLNKSH
jgi:NADH-quinone oxidoreductase subunit G